MTAETSVQGFRLSPQQVRVWSLQQAAPELPLHAWCSVRLRGGLDRSALQAALASVAGQHEILRTTFRVLPDVGLPVQVVGEGAEVTPAFRDLSTLPAHEVAGEEGAWLDSLAAGLRGASGSPLRVALFRRGDQEHAFYLALPAACADALTLDNLVGQVGAAYARIAGGAQPQPEEAVQYVDFSEWVNEMLASDEARDGRSFWSGRQSPSGAALLDLWPAGVNGGGPTGTHHHALSPALSRAVGEVARGHGVDAAAWLLAAWQVLLSRHAGRGEITVGVGVEGRTYPEFQRSLGPFAKYVPVPGHVREGEPFSARVAEVDAALAESRSWQDFYAWEPSAAEGDVRPGFGFDYAESPAEEMCGGVAWRVERRWHQTDRFGLRLSVERVTEGGEAALRATLYYDAATQSSEGAARLLRRFARLLEDTIHAPAARVGALTLADDDERQEVLLRWNATAAEFPADVPVHHLFAAQAARTPDAVALGFDGGTMTFADLDARANQIAHGLRARGVGPDARVGVLLERSPEMIAAILAVLKAGGAYVPLDPGYPTDRVRFIAENGALEIVIASAGLEGRLGEETAVRVVTVAEMEGAALPAAGGPRVEVSPRNAAYVFYTSGSTGTPKGVIVEHGGLANQMSWMQQRFPLNADDVVLQKTPFVFDASVWEILAPLLAGARLELAPQGSHADGAYLADAVGRLGVTTLQVVPSQLRLVQASGGFAGWTGLRRLFSGGEALTDALRSAVFAALPKVEVINLYGPTETTVQVAYWRSAGDEEGPVPIGRPISNAQLYVLDGALRPVPVGVRGELYVGGAGVSRGYMSRPALTADCFIPDAFGGEAGARLYRSGDVARWRPDGALEYLGRADGQVKVRGYRVETGEIEAVLERHPAVRAAAVVVRGEAGEERLVAYWTAAASATADELRAHLSAHLPPYMVPGAIVELEAFPLLPSGKVDRRALPDPEETASAAPYEAPANAIEEVLALVWAEILGAERVGVHDNFFALGGDSILSVRIVGMARDRGVRLSVQDVFEHQTVRALARRAEQGIGEAELMERVLNRDRQPFDLIPEEDRAKLPEDAVDAYPLAALQAGMLYEQGLNPEVPAYHNINSYHFRAPWDEAAFRAAVQRSVDLHENLRTSIHLSGFSQMLQVVHARAEVPIHVEDIRHLPESEHERYLDEFRAREFRNLPELTRAPLMWLHVHRRADDRFQLTLTECHSIADGWSTTSLFADVFQDYAALLRGEPFPERAEPAVRFRDFVEMERDTAASDESRRFWATRLEGMAAAPIARLPEALRRPAQTGTETLSVPLTPELRAGLLALARSLAVPLKSVLLAGHLKVLGTVTGRDEVVTGLPSNGRPEVSGGTDVRGLFLNVLPFRARLHGGSWAELARETFRAEVEALPHRRYPLALLQREHGPERLFEVNFNLVHFHSFSGVLREGVVQVLGNRDVADTSHTVLVAVGLDTLTGEILSFGLQYRRSELTRAQVERMAEYYHRVYQAMVDDPTARYHAFTPLTADERASALARPTMPAPAGDAACLHDTFAERARRAPDAPAVSFEGRTLTYAELDRASSQLANHLRARGVRPGDRVALSLDRSPELVAAILGVLKAGAAYVPVDPRSPAERIAFILRDAGTEVVIAHHGAAEQLPAGVRLICPESERARILAADDRAPLHAATPGGEAYVIYTSGSTGQPKGVVVTHANVARLFAATREWLQPSADDVWTLFHSYAFDFSVWEMWGALLHGGRLAVVPYGTARSPAEFRALLARERVTVLSQTPSAFYQLAKADEGAGEADALALRMVVFGGEALEPARLRTWIHRYGHETPRLVNMYGITETTVHATVRRVTGADVDAAARSPIGEPLPDLGLYLLDPHGNPVPVGVPGEIHVGGAGVARGYLNRPALTAERFVPDPFGPAGARLYRSGDRARRLPGGELEFLGRIDQQVKVRGFRVEPGEVEAVLATHPSVREAVVVAHPDPVGGARLVAYAGVGGAASDAAELRRYLQRSLPDHMVPAAVVVLETLPLTVNGKVDRRALPPPSRAGAAGGVPRALPATRVEARLAALWGELLGRDEVGVEDSFFDLGGHSLLLVQLQSRLASDFGVALELIDLLEFPTVRALAARLQGRSADAVAERAERAERAETGADARAGAAERRREARRRRVG